MAGIPLTSGFTGKFAVFPAAISGGATPLVVVGALSSAIAAFFYVRVIVLMFFCEPGCRGPVGGQPSVSTGAAVAVGVAVTLVLGVVPGPLLDLAQQAAPAVCAVTAGVRPMRRGHDVGSRCLAHIVMVAWQMSHDSMLVSGQCGIPLRESE